MRNLNWVVISDEHLYDSIKYIREHYGNSVNVVFIPTLGFTPLTEENIIFSRAASKFQHLINMDAF
jgi:hypothetical protein